MEVLYLCAFTNEEESVLDSTLLHPSLALLTVDGPMKPALLAMENSSHQLLKGASSLQQGIVGLVLLEAKRRQMSKIQWRVN